MDDKSLLDFDTSRLASFDPATARSDLEDHGDLYRNHLVIAHWIDGWRQRMDEVPNVGGTFEYAAREIAVHLRQGDFLPGGVLYDETVEGL